MAERVGVTLQDTVARVFPRLAPKQQRVARFLAANEALVAFTPATELAARLEVDPATVVRLTRVLGFQGYPHLQRHLRARFPHHYPTLAAAANGNPEGSLLQRAFAQDYENLRLGLELVDENAFDHTVELLTTANRTLIFGGGVAAGLVIFLGTSLRSMGFAVQTSADGPPLVQELVQLTPRDVAVGIGFYRYVGQTVTVLRRAKSNGVPCVALTDSLLSPLVQIADHALCAPVESISHRVSLVAPFAVANALVAACARHRPEQVAATLRRLDEEYHAAGLLTDG